MIERIDIAHVRQDANGIWKDPQLLEDHLNRVAVCAAEFANGFDSSCWGYLAGMLHDTGKGTREWQNYIRNISGFESEEETDACNRIDHSSPGAKLCTELFPGMAGKILAYVVSGHHTGLPDWIGSRRSLNFRLQHAGTEGISERYRDMFSQKKPLSPPWLFDSTGLDVSLWIRMLYSCLVDADFLDTESYMDSVSSGLRSGYKPVSELLDPFQEYMQKFKKTESTTTLSTVNDIRNSVLFDCIAAAEESPGLFSLTVPTGGGKTLSSLAFALNHAKRYGKIRIIYVIPYTSIIEQTANVFKRIFGEEQVIEHHSNFDTADASQKVKLASENWDAPIIVTTSVQFFESLVTAKPSRCRKLHNIVNSVVIMDEVQLLPVEYLKPILETMQLLCRHYRVTALFSTATQPAFECQDDFPMFPGIPKGRVREIVSDVPRLYTLLKRVEVEPIDVDTVKSLESIAEEISGFSRVLCIVSDRKSCRELYAHMPKGTFHLSALMCPEHRSEVIEQIREKLRGDGPVRVVSTQLVEAGVDIDFPVVYRSIAGFDSIAQAAGRCNREGKLDKGKLVVFVPPRRPPVGILRKATDTTVGLINEGYVDFFDSTVFKRYFSNLYWLAESFDTHGIVDLLSKDLSSCFGIQFREASDRFVFIDDKEIRNIFVPYKDGARLIEALKNENTVGTDHRKARMLLRRLQRYTVSIYRQDFEKLRRRGSLVEIWPDTYALNSIVEYDRTKGLLIDESNQDPEAYLA
jgi:CRISPR-associated endonuclease/helicase Cas3